MTIQRILLAPEAEEGRAVEPESGTPGVQARMERLTQSRDADEGQNQLLNASPVLLQVLGFAQMLPGTHDESSQAGAGAHWIVVASRQPRRWDGRS